MQSVTRCKRFSQLPPGLAQYPSPTRPSPPSLCPPGAVRHTGEPGGGGVRGHWRPAGRGVGRHTGEQYALPGSTLTACLNGLDCCMCWGQHLHLRLAARFEPVGFVCGMLWLSSVTSCFPSPAAPAGPAGHPAHAAGAPHPEAAGGGGRPALCWVQGRQAGAGGLHCAGFGAGRHPPTLPPTPCRLLRVAPLPQELVQRCGVNPKYEEAGLEEGGAARVHVKASPVVALSG